MPDNNKIYIEYTIFMIVVSIAFICISWWWHSRIPNEEQRKVAIIGIMLGVVSLIRHISELLIGLAALKAEKAEDEIIHPDKSLVFSERYLPYSIYKELDKSIAKKYGILLNSRIKITVNAGNYSTSLIGALVLDDYMHLVDDNGGEIDFNEDFSVTIEGIEKSNPDDFFVFEEAVGKIYTNNSLLRQLIHVSDYHYVLARGGGKEISLVRVSKEDYTWLQNSQITKPGKERVFPVEDSFIL